MEKLHLGAFNCPLDGWINTDVTPHLHIAKVPGLAWSLYRLGKLSANRYEEHSRGVFGRLRYLNVTRPWNLASDRFNAIFSAHMLEHLTLAGAKNCLAESYRCLKSGGVLRISVPDLDKWIAAYRTEEALSWATGFFEANESSEKNMHHFMYNYEGLSALLLQAGFQHVHRREFQQGQCPDLLLLDNRPDSLFVEAIKR